MEGPVQLNINLLPTPTRNKVITRWVGGIVIIALLALLGDWIYITQSRQLHKQQVENLYLQAALKEYETEMTDYKSIQVMEEELAIRRNTITALEQTRRSYTEALGEIDRLKPETITIIGVEITPQKVVVNGYSPDHSSVSRMLEGIKTSPVFGGVAILSSEMNENTREVKFNLEMEWGAAFQ